MFCSDDRGREHQRLQQPGPDDATRGRYETGHGKRPLSSEETGRRERQVSERVRVFVCVCVRVCVCVYNQCDAECSVKPEEAQTLTCVCVRV